MHFSCKINARKCVDTEIILTFHSLPIILSTAFCFASTGTRKSLSRSDLLLSELTQQMLFRLIKETTHIYLSFIFKFYTVIQMWDMYTEMHCAVSRSNVSNAVTDFAKKINRLIFENVKHKCLRKMLEIHKCQHFVYSSK